MERLAITEIVLGSAPLIESLEKSDRRPNSNLVAERSPSPRSDPSPDLTRRG